MRGAPLALVHRWLRDAEYRPAWDRLVEEVEENVDLAAWAEDTSLGAPSRSHTSSGSAGAGRGTKFEAAAAKESVDRSVLQLRTATMLAEQAEFLKATNQELGIGNFCETSMALSVACAAARSAVAKAGTAKRLRDLRRKRPEIDGAHIEIRYAAEEAGLPAVASVADRSYAAYTNALNEAFFQQVAAARSLEGSACQASPQHLEQSVWKAHGRRAVIIVDAFATTAPSRSAIYCAARP